MKTLGASATGSTLWLALIVDGEPTESTPVRIEGGAGLERGQQLVALLDDCTRILRDIEPDAVAVLEPEANGTFTFRQSRDRVAIEVMLSLAAAQLDIPCQYLSRPTVRSRLRLDSAGKLVDHVAKALPKPLSPHWKGKRDLAALAALAEQGDLDAAG